MSQRPRSEVRTDIISEATTWFVDLNEDPQNHSTREAFDRWLRRSPEHVHAFLQVSAHWEENTPGPGATVESVDELIALAQTETNIIRLPHQAAPQHDVVSDVVGDAHHASKANDRPPDSPRRHRAGRSFVLAASILLALAAGGVVWRYFFTGVYSTGVGEQYAITLADGSTVELNALSRVRVRYTGLERRVELLEGQALFRVARDKLRPFRVQSVDAQVRAVGTQFDVYRKESGTTVTVVEGSVAVVPVLPPTGAIESSRSANRPSRETHETALENTGVHNPGTSSRSIGAGSSDVSAGEHSHDEVYLVAGEQLTVEAHVANAAGPFSPQHADVKAVTAWTDHRLIFKDTPLAEVVTEFNRHSRRPLVITDPAIAATRISGAFSSSDPAALLLFLSEVGSYSVHETSSAIEISHK
jgi:transmembrane sensor